MTRSVRTYQAVGKKQMGASQMTIFRVTKTIIWGETKRSSYQTSVRSLTVTMCLSLNMVLGTDGVTLLHSHSGRYRVTCESPFMSVAGRLTPTAREFSNPENVARIGEPMVVSEPAAAAFSLKRHRNVAPLLLARDKVHGHCENGQLWTRNREEVISKPLGFTFKVKYLQ